MTSGHFGQMDVGIETDFLEIGYAVGVQGVVEVLGNRVGIQAGNTLAQLGSSKPQLAHDVAGTMQEIGCVLAVLDSFANILGVFGAEDTVHVCQHGAQCESHGKTAPRDRKNERP